MPSWMQRQSFNRVTGSLLSLSMVLSLTAMTVTVNAEDMDDAQAPAIEEQEVTPVLKTTTEKKELGVPDMLIRALPLDVTGYEEASKIDAAAQNAQATVDFINSTPSQLLHMEVIRRAYHNYGQDADQHQQLMTLLNDRYQANNSDPAVYFDFGYAELVFDANKNGLFFLRKANDNLALPYTSLAYGMAQIDADRVFEHSAKTEMTPRKLDASYKLKDALMFNKSDPQPNVWSNYIKILDALEDYPAFDSLKREDVTSMVVPYGAGSLGTLSVGKDSTQKLALSDGSSSFDPSSVECNLNETDIDITQLKKTKAYDATSDGQLDAFNFYRQGEDRPYLVQVQDGKTQGLLAQFNSYSMSLVEDLEGDGTTEIVVRQFDYTRENPLMVYRWNGTCFVKDTYIEQLFN